MRPSIYFSLWKKDQEVSWLHGTCHFCREKMLANERALWASWRRCKMQQHLQFKTVFKSEIKAASIISFNTREVTNFLRDGCTSAKFQTSTRRVYRGLKPNAHPPRGCGSSSHTGAGTASETQSQVGRYAVIRKVTELNARQQDDTSGPLHAGNQS